MDISEYKVIRGARVFSPDSKRADPADVIIKGNRIIEVGKPGLQAPSEAVPIEATDRLMVPGLINAHTHGHGSLGKGWGDRWTLELLLNAGPWISAGRSLEHKALAAKLAAAEMIAKGCTAAYDLYVEVPEPTVDGMQAVAQGYLDAGFRVLLAPMVADRTFFEAIPGLSDALPRVHKEAVGRVKMAPADRTLATCRALVEGWPFDRQRAGVALAPTIPLHCTDDYLRAHRDLARELEVRMHMHLGESKVQAQAGMRTYGKTLTAHLDSIGFLGPGFTAAHAVWLDLDDMTRLADNGCSVAHNPGSNMRLGSGLAAVREMLEAGVNVGVGTDGAHCADNQNMYEAMRFTSFVSRVRTHDYERWLKTSEVLELATLGSATALGLDGEVGRICEGYLADLVLLDLGSVNWIPFNDPANLLVHTEDGSAVETVMIDGELVYSNRQFVNLDLAALRLEAETALGELTGLNHDVRAFSEEIERYVGRFCIGLCEQPYHVHAMAGAHY